jgi:hypothetical protein
MQYLLRIIHLSVRHLLGLLYIGNLIDQVILCEGEGGELRVPLLVAVRVGPEQGNVGTEQRGLGTEQGGVGYTRGV